VINIQIIQKFIEENYANEDNPVGQQDPIEFNSSDGMTYVD
jgi:hypothetical protein